MGHRRPPEATPGCGRPTSRSVASSPILCRRAAGRPRGRGRCLRGTRSSPGRAGHEPRAPRGSRTGHRLRAGWATGDRSQRAMRCRCGRNGRRIRGRFWAHSRMTSRCSQRHLSSNMPRRDALVGGASPASTRWPGSRLAGSSHARGVAGDRGPSEPDHGRSPCRPRWLRPPRSCATVAAAPMPTWRPPRVGRTRGRGPGGRRCRPARWATREPPNPGAARLQDLPRIDAASRTGFPERPASCACPGNGAVPRHISPGRGGVHANDRHLVARRAGAPRAVPAARVHAPPDGAIRRRPGFVADLSPVGAAHPGAAIGVGGRFRDGPRSALGPDRARL